MKIQIAKNWIVAALCERCLRRSQTAATMKSGHGAFTLIEVMFAVVIFFTASFSILALVSQSIDNARRLQRPTVDAGLVASELSLTNQLVEGTESGDLGELLGDSYSGYAWTCDITEVQSNKLFQADIILQSKTIGKPVVSAMKVLFYRPQSPEGSLDGATVAK
jgi:hypothetical protein